jgi:Fic family protein
VAENKLLRMNDIEYIQSVLIGNYKGYRKTAGTIIANDKTGKVVHTPPQEYDQIIQHMRNLENYINDDELCDLDTLIKMAIVHHQFESIHPFQRGFKAWK